MATHVRDLVPDDHDGIVALALRAWAPVYESTCTALGAELALLLHGEDWREHQAREVHVVLASPSNKVWVAELDGALAGFVAAAVVDEQRLMGRVVMVAVDPSAQNQGVGAMLTEHAARWLREQGMRLAVIGTGGDPGHAPARRLYERLGYQPLPIVHYFRAL